MSLSVPHIALQGKRKKTFMSIVTYIWKLKCGEENFAGKAMLSFRPFKYCQQIYIFNTLNNIVQSHKARHRIFNIPCFGEFRGLVKLKVSILIISLLFLFDASPYYQCVFLSKSPVLRSRDDWWWDCRRIYKRCRWFNNMVSPLINIYEAIESKSTHWLHTKWEDSLYSIVFKIIHSSDPVLETWFVL